MRGTEAAFESPRLTFRKPQIKELIIAQRQQSIT